MYGGAAEWRLRVQARRERNAVENFMRVAIEYAENAVFSSRGNGRPRVYLEDWIYVEDVVIVHIVRNELVVPHHAARLPIQCDDGVRIQI